MAAIRPRARFVPVFLAVAAGWMIHPAISLSGDAGGSSLVILAPSHATAMKVGRVLVIGRASGEGIARVEIDVNGKVNQTAAVSRGGFSGSVYLSPGRNVIRVSAGEASAAITVSAAEKGAYAYHEPVEKCAECHGASGKGYAVAAPKESLCYRCHDRLDKGKLLHGPMGSGDCMACHDPHGSANGALTVARHETLCFSCHDQTSSAGHFRKSGGKPCTSCHDPHSSDRPFLQK